ncbi:hypothetical protein, partial [Bacillus cereus]|uniref:hypothetical protein n=1 Tax=Bacillus cereus TaxID=1396 RepID=UPI0034D641C0
PRLDCFAYKLVFRHFSKEPFVILSYFHKLEERVWVLELEELPPSPMIQVLSFFSCMDFIAMLG